MLSDKSVLNIAHADDPMLSDIKLASKLSNECGTAFGARSAEAPHDEPGNGVHPQMHEVEAPGST